MHEIDQLEGERGIMFEQQRKSPPVAIAAIQPLMALTFAYHRHKILPSDGGINEARYCSRSALSCDHRGFGGGCCRVYGTNRSSFR